MEKILILMLVICLGEVVNGANTFCGRCFDPTPSVDGGDFDPRQGNRLASLDCDPGYLPVGHRHITCVAEEWVDSNGICQALTGTQFVTIFPRLKTQIDEYELRRVMITAADTPTNVTIQVDGTTQVFTVTDFATRDFPIDLTLENTNTINDSVLLISSDNPINVHTLVSSLGSGAYSLGSFINLPVGNLYTKYLLMTTEQRPQFNVVAVQDNTTVNIELVAGNSPIVVTLNQYEVYTRFFGNAIDRSGNEITSDKPVAVFSGGFFSRVPNDGGTRDVNVVQLIGVADWQTLCIMGPYKPREGFQFKVVASLDSTQVDLTVNGVTDTISLNEGEFYSQVVYPNLTDQNVVVKSDKPTLVGQFSLNNQVGDGQTDSDSSLTLCIPPADFLPLYAFFSPSPIVSSIVRIVIRTAYKADLRLNGSPLTIYDQINGVMVPGGDSYDIVFIMVMPDVSYVLETTSVEPFGADLYGVNADGPTQFAHTLGRKIV